MLFSELLKPFLEKRPVAVMARACLEHAFASAEIDELFRQTATVQYQHRILFSSLVQLLGAVVTRRYASVNAAYRAESSAVGASLSSVYDKLNHTEPVIAEALVGHTADKLRAVFTHWPSRAQPIAALKLTIIDGNYFGGTDHRLQVLRGHGAAALPGMAVVVQDHATGLLTHLFGEEDGYVNERALVERILTGIGAGEVIVADRNFCVSAFFSGIAARQSYFIVRHHSQSPLQTIGRRRRVGKTDTGIVFEQMVAMVGKQYRMITVELNEPTTDGDMAIHLLTNLSVTQASAVLVAETYRLRWRLEATFLEATQTVQCELNTLGYPKAALLTFALALCACNALRVVVRALELSQLTNDEPQEVSSYYIVNELNVIHEGMDIIATPEVWEPVRVMTSKTFATWLLTLAGQADWRRYRKSPRGPKKPVQKQIGGRRNPHRSTYRLLNLKSALPRPPA
jgi:Transposase DDE domain